MTAESPCIFLCMLPSLFLWGVIILVLLPLPAAGQSNTCPAALLVDKGLRVTKWSFVMNIREPEYDFGQAQMKCNSLVTEYLVYDLTVGSVSKTSQSRQFSLDYVDEFSLVSVTSPQALITGTTTQFLTADGQTSGTGVSKSVVIKWSFSLKPGSSYTNTSFILTYNVVGVMKSDASGGYSIQWWPFMDNFLDNNALIGNITATFSLPWGLSSQGVSTPPGYTITTNMVTDTTWTADRAVVVFSQTCYNYQFDGHFDLKLLMNAKGVTCNQMPGWTIAVIVLACIFGTLMVCSFLAFVFFEKPYRFLQSAEEVDRVKYIEDDNEVPKPGPMRPVQKRPSSRGGETADGRTYAYET
eukprot:GGOE01044821.1.p1 GENE.GGOE01044821.1~~GGOE01044821.1.p1  ORF type:complete len:355 (+),score=120.44 GGOE01044821.1:78-1142(+)